MYDDLRRAVEKLHEKIQHPDKKEALGYVLSLFKLQDENRNALRELVPMPSRAEERERKKNRPKDKARVEAGKKAMETRRARAAVVAEKLMDGGL